MTVDELRKLLEDAPGDVTVGYVSGGSIIREVEFVEQMIDYNIVLLR